MPCGAPADCTLHGAASALIVSAPQRQPGRVYAATAATAASCCREVCATVRALTHRGGAAAESVVCPGPFASAAASGGAASKRGACLSGAADPLCGVRARCAAVSRRRLSSGLTPSPNAHAPPGWHAVAASRRVVSSRRRWWPQWLSRRTALPAARRMFRASCTRTSVARRPWHMPLRTPCLAPSTAATRCVAARRLPLAARGLAPAPRTPLRRILAAFYGGGFR